MQLPPKAYTTINKFDLNFPLIVFGDSSSTVSFNETNSPLHFRNYLAIAKDNNFSNQIFIDNDFWITEVETKIVYDNYLTPTLEGNKISPDAFFILNQNETGDNSGSNKKLIKVIGNTCAITVLIGALGVFAILATQ